MQSPTKMLEMVREGETGRDTLEPPRGMWVIPEVFLSGGGGFARKEFVSLGLLSHIIIKNIPSAFPTFLFSFSSLISGY